MTKLPAPIAAPRVIAGQFFCPTPAQFAELAAIKAGDQFLYEGQHCLATADAEPYPRGLFIKACRKHPAMPSGWALGDLIIWPPK